MIGMGDDPDFDRLIARIHADLRSGRRSARPRRFWRNGKLRSALGAWRGGPAARSARLQRATRWLVPSLIFATVTVVVLLTGAR